MSRDYYKVRIDVSPCSEDITDLAAAFLADTGFETFEPDDSGLTAFIPVDLADYPVNLTKNALSDFPIPTSFSISSKLIPGQDWNEEWEKNYFKPIVIADRCVVHSSFHHDIPKAEFDIAIDPKMAFGTGHHQTTSLMVSRLLQENLTGRSLIDMGTGTGILAILAAMRGASPVIGIEIDKGAWENAIENRDLNKVAIDILCGNASLLDGLNPTDYFLANINRNIILADIPTYSKSLKPGGILLLSGFYEDDIPLISAEARKWNLEYTDFTAADNWVSVRFIKNAL